MQGAAGRGAAVTHGTGRFTCTGGAKLDKLHVKL